MKIGIIGAGKVGTSIGKYLVENHLPIAGYYSKTKESADKAATFTNTHAYRNISDLVNECDTIFITTPDGVISKIWQEISKFPLSDKIVCHFSGSLSSEIFSNNSHTNVYGCSIHPMFAFSDKFTSYKEFNKALLTVEGNDKALERIVPIFRVLGHRILQIESEKKTLYHAAASMASNHLVALLDTSTDLLKKCGFSEEDARALLFPLASSNLNTAMSTGASKALSGPLERCDVETVKRHMEALYPLDAGAVYITLSRKILKIAKEKHKNRDYTLINNLITYYWNLTFEKQIFGKEPFSESTNVL